MKSLFPETSGAIFSDCKVYRYALHRIWDRTKPLMVFVMMNPSTANDVDDDPTIRRCMSFAKREGYGGISVKNVFALRSPYPKSLLEIDDPFGPENEQHLLNACLDARVLVPNVEGWPEAKAWPKIVVAWGNRFGGARLEKWYDKAVDALRGLTVYCLGTNAGGEPKHPLYVHGKTPLIPWRVT